MSGKILELKSNLDVIQVSNHLIRSFMHDAYDDENNYFKINIEISNSNKSPQRSTK